MVQNLFSKTIYFIRENTFHFIFLNIFIIKLNNILKLNIPFPLLLFFTILIVSLFYKFLSKITYLIIKTKIFEYVLFYFLKLKNFLYEFFLSLIFANSNRDFWKMLAFHYFIYFFVFFTIILYSDNLIFFYSIIGLIFSIFNNIELYILTLFKSDDDLIKNQILSFGLIKQKLNINENNNTKNSHKFPFIQKRLILTTLIANEGKKGFIITSTTSIFVGLTAFGSSYLYGREKTKVAQINADALIAVKNAEFEAMQKAKMVDMHKELLITNRVNKNNLEQSLANCQDGASIFNNYNKYKIATLTKQIQESDIQTSKIIDEISDKFL